MKPRRARSSMHDIPKGEEPRRLWSWMRGWTPKVIAEPLAPGGPPPRIRAPRRSLAAGGPEGYPALWMEQQGTAISPKFV